MSQDIGDTCLGSSATPSRRSMLGHAAADVESSPGHHRPVRRPPDPCRGRRPVRHPPRVGLQAQGPLRGRGRGRARAPLPTPKDLPGRPVSRGRRPDRAGPQRVDRRRPGRRPRDNRVAPRAPPRTPDIEIDHQPSPDRGRAGDPRAEEATDIRFEASMPNETWQSDFTHHRLTRPDRRPGADVEIISWLDDCTRYALHVTAHPMITTPIVKQTFREAAGQHGIPASTLTDNGMVYTVRLAGIGRQGGRNGFEQQLRDWNVTQKNSRPSHPTTCGKVERFQQTMKKWLRAQPIQPSTIAELQALLDLRHRAASLPLRAHDRDPHAVNVHQTRPARRQHDQPARPRRGEIPGQPLSRPPVLS
jgi:Integrase core domain